MTSTDADAQVALARENTLATVRDMMRHPARMAPFAVVIGEQQIITMPILNLADRVEVLRFGIARVHGFAFLLFYDGQLGAEEMRAATSDALFVITMTQWGHGSAVAYPYTRSPLTGLLFEDAVEHPDVEWIYRAVFGPPPTIN